MRFHASTVEILLWCCAASCCAYGQDARIEAAHIEPTESRAGPLLATIGGRTLKIADEVLAFWIFEGGREIAYSARDGAGGFEGEGQSLWLYNAARKQRRKILAEYFAIENVEETITSNRRKALLVKMSDGGLGASHVAVVDPTRGEVFVAAQARVIERDGDMIVIGFYREADWESINGGKSVPAYRKRRYDLKRLLQRHVMIRKYAP